MSLSSIVVAVILVVFAVLGVSAQAVDPNRIQQVPIEIEKADLKPMQGQVVWFRSGIYGDLQPVAICTTDLSNRPKPLLVDLIPGTLTNVERAAKNCEETCQIARKAGLDCVAVRPCGRGNGSVYQGYGEVDVHEAIAAVRQKLAIDPDRISVSGASMGGAATWYHASHRLDSWSAAAPFCGYCDYRLWEKPNGTTFPWQPWEEPSWQGRDAAYRVANLRNLNLRILHGEWDRAVGGGVPVEHSRQMHRKLNELGIAHEYFEVPKTGHGVRTTKLWEETVPWLLTQKRVVDPNDVSLVVHTLRHNRAHGVGVEQQERSGVASTVRARFDRAGGTVRVQTGNVRILSLGRRREATAFTVEIDLDTFRSVDLTTSQHFLRSPAGAWSKVKADPAAGEKRHGLSGPFGDLFYAPIVIVAGESGTDAETEYNRIMAGNAVRFYNQYNGGVHRGGITGDNVVRIPILSDKRLLEIESGQVPAATQDGITIDTALLQRANLFFIGNYDSNAALARLRERLPLSFGKDRIQLAGKTFTGDHLAFYAILPHPDGKRYVALLSGNEPDAICWGSHMGLQLLPDYLVFSRERVVEWGFWNNTWKQGGKNEPHSGVTR